MSLGIVAIQLDFGIHVCLLFFRLVSILCLTIILKEIFCREEQQRVLFPFPFHGLIEDAAELGAQAVSCCPMLIRIIRTERDVRQVFLAIGIEGADIVHVISHNANHVSRKVGINITVVQNVVLIKMLLWHSEYSSHGLSGKSHALQFSEYQEYGCTRTIPTQGNGLLEQQHLGNIIRLSDILKIGRFIL